VLIKGWQQLVLKSTFKKSDWQNVLIGLPVESQEIEFRGGNNKMVYHCGVGNICFIFVDETIFLFQQKDKL